jgi:hypothetical protein
MPLRSRDQLYLVVPGEAKWEDSEVDYRLWPCPRGFVVVDLIREVDTFSTVGRVLAWIPWRCWIVRIIPSLLHRRRLWRNPYATIVAVLKRQALPEKAAAPAPAAPPAAS